MTPLQILTCGHPSPKVRCVFSRLKEIYDFVDIPLESDFKSTSKLKRIALAILLVPENFQLAIKKLKEIKASQANLPVIMVGPKLDNYHLIEAFREGIADYVMEPFASKEILDSIDKCTQQPPNRSAASTITTPGWIQQLSVFFLRMFKGGGLTIDSGKMSLTPLPPIATVLNTKAKKVDLNVQFFGQFEMVFRGQEVQLQGTKSRSLLAYLLYNRNKAIHRDILMDKFWPDTSNSSARNSLNVAIHNIRKAFQKVDEGRDCILYKNECYGFCESLRIATDIDQFKQYWEQGRSKEQIQGNEAAILTYQKAYAFYRGDLLEDLLYEDWTTPHRENLRETYLVILDRLSSYYFQSAQYNKVIDLCKKVLLLDKCMEDIHIRLIQAYFKSGKRGKAIRKYQECVKILREELNVEPSESLLKLWKEIS